MPRANLVAKCYLLPDVTFVCVGASTLFHKRHMLLKVAHYVTLKSGLLGPAGGSGS